MDFTLARDWPYAAGAGAYVVLTVGGAVGGWRARRRLRRRLSALALRTAEDSDSSPAALHSAGTERLLAALERGVDSAIESANNSAAAVARLAGALDAMPWAVFVCDEDGRLVLRNVAATALRSEPDLADMLERVVGAPAGGPGDVGAEKTLELTGPPRQTLRVRSGVIDNGRRVVGILVIAEDRTETLRLEQNEKELVATAGERLRAPMSAMASLADAVAREIEGSSAVSARAAQRLTDRLRQEAERAEHVVEELLTQARADARPATGDSLTVEDLVERATRVVTTHARRRNVTIRVDHDVPAAAVTGDRRQLVGAVAELLDNAVRCSSPGRPVEVTTTCGADVTVTVADAGPGVPEEERERIFERFHRVERRGAAAYPGLGLGLSIVQKVAHNHGGSVTVATGSEGGALFTLRLPRPASVEETEWRIGSPA